MNISQKELALQLHISQQAYAKYETGKSSPNPETLAAICRCLDVSPDYLLNIEQKKSKVDHNFIEVVGVSLPCFGKEYDNFIGHLPTDGEPIDFCFRVSDNSMIGAGIRDGDCVFIRKQPQIGNGEIALVRVDQKISLRRVYYDIGEMKLFPENPNDRPMYYREDDFNQIQILGKALSVYSDLN